MRNITNSLKLPHEDSQTPDLKSCGVFAQLLFCGSIRQIEEQVMVGLPYNFVFILACLVDSHMLTTNPILTLAVNGSLLRVVKQ